MASSVGEHFTAEVNKYYKVQERYTELLEKSMSQEAKTHHDAKPERRDADQKRPMKRTAQAMSSLGWISDFEQEDMFTAFRDLGVENESKKSAVEKTDSKT